MTGKRNSLSWIVVDKHRLYNNPKVSNAISAHVNTNRKGYLKSEKSRFRDLKPKPCFGSRFPRHEIRSKLSNSKSFTSYSGVFRPQDS